MIFTEVKPTENVIFTSIPCLKHLEHLELLNRAEISLFSKRLPLLYAQLLKCL